MPPSGAIFCVALIWLLNVRLAIAEEPFLTQQFGEPYVEYRKAVPRFLPSPTPQVPAAGKPAHWLQGFFGEIYMVGVVITYAVFGWNFNATTMIRGVLISLGAWIIVKAFLPKAKSRRQENRAELERVGGCLPERGVVEDDPVMWTGDFGELPSEAANEGESYAE